MSDLVLRTTTRTQTQLYALTAVLIGCAHRATERMRSEERGADVVEYVGMLIFAALVVTVLITAANGLGSQIVTGITSKITQILGH